MVSIKKLLLSVFTFSVFCVPAFSAIVVTQDFGMDTSCSVGSKSLAVTSAPGDTFLAVTLVSHTFADPQLSVTFNGDALTKATSTLTAGATLSTWYLKNPDIGTFNLIATVTGATGCIAMGGSLMSGVDLTAAIPTDLSSDGSTPYSIRVNTPNVGMFTYGSFITSSGLTMVAGANGIVGSQPETLGFGGWFGYTSQLSTTNPSFMDYTGGGGTMYAASMSLTPSSGGGGSAPAVNPKVAVIPASLYSQKILQAPVATTTYSFLSTAASSSLKQTGLVFIVHNATATPSVKWGTTTMTRIDTTDSFGVSTTTHKVSMYVIRNPVSFTGITVSSTTANGIRYLSESVWSNADIIPVFDKYKLVNDVDRAYLSLPTINTPSLMISAFYSSSSPASSVYQILNTTNVVQLSTSTAANTNNFALVISQCNSALDDCQVGYNKTFLPVDTRAGVLIGLAMYSTSTINASNVPSLLDLAGGLGTDEGFSQCLPDGFTNATICVFKNIIWWFFGLFVPSTEDMIGLRDTFYNNVTASSSLTSAVFLIPLQFSQWTNPSSTPPYNKLEIYVPSFINKTWVLDPEPATQTDNAVHDILEWVFGVIMVLYIGYKFYKLV